MMAKRTVELIRYLDAADSLSEPLAVCLGFFDGVHLGHRSIIDAGKQIARQEGIRLCVHTYDIPPARLTRHEAAQIELTPLEEKCALLMRAGADIVAVSRFDEHMMRQSGRDFFFNVILDRLHARYLIAGFNHRFGYRGDTDMTALKSLCDEAGIGLRVLPPVTAPGGQIISSSAIRQALLSGNLLLAQEMLGRPPGPELQRLSAAPEAGPAKDENKTTEGS